ncbi:MAG: hypothetical protein MZV70_00095 [Desulfobacterales bacterium]|nr:hypothetical protein [Desulfobacterales bacterium]
MKLKLIEPLQLPVQGRGPRARRASSGCRTSSSGASPSRARAWRSGSWARSRRAG